MFRRLRKSDKIEILEKLPLFEECTQQELGQLATITVDAERPAGTLLTRQGRAGGLMFIIVDGQADVIAGAPGNGEKVIGQLGAGDVVGELSLIDGQARSASVRAVTDVHLLQIASDDFSALVNDSPKFVHNLLRALSLKVRQMDALAT
jgi:CRP-like cAMP-binding protein